VTILPQGLRGRIRGLQTHKRKEQVAVPGSRTAVNISGVDVDQIRRGDIVAHPGDYVSTRRLDVYFRLLPDVSQPVRHNMEVKLFLGAAELVARLRLLGADVLNPGEEGWLQLELQQPVVAVRNDRYILRRPSPGETLGGGIVLDAHPKGRHKRFNQKVLDRLEALVAGTPTDVLLQSLLTMGIAPLQDVIAHSSLEDKVAWEAAGMLFTEGQILILGTESTLKPGSLVTSQVYWNQISQRAIQEVGAYHQNFPLRTGMPREELKSRLGLPPRLFNAFLGLLIADGNLIEKSLRLDIPGNSAVPVLMSPDHGIRFSPAQERSIDQLLDRFRENPYNPPTIKECLGEVGEDVYAALVELGKLAPVSPEVVFHHEGYEQMIAQVREMLDARGTISVAEVRDRFDTSRRYVLALLEHLDAMGVTVRAGDVHKLKKGR
jgi:selenocysteine-specific elongation factor